MKEYIDSTGAEESARTLLFRVRILYKSNYRNLEYRVYYPKYQIDAFNLVVSGMELVGFHLRSRVGHDCTRPCQARNPKP